MARVIMMIIFLSFCLNFSLCWAGNENSNSSGVDSGGSITIETARMLQDIRSQGVFNSEVNTVAMPSFSSIQVISNYPFQENSMLQNSFLSESNFSSRFQDTLSSNPKILDNAVSDKSKDFFNLKSKDEANYGQKAYPISFKETDTFSPK